MDDIESVRAAIPANFARGQFDLAAWNANDAVNRYVERLAVLLRSGAEPETLRAEIEAASAFIDHIENAVRQCDADTAAPRRLFHLMNFLWSIVLLMLAADWSRLARIAALSRLPVVHEEGLGQATGGVDDTIVRMLQAALADDRAAFLAAQARFASARKVDRYYRVYFCYDELMDSVLQRDAAALAAGLARMDKLFHQRAHDARLKQLPPLGAAGQDNAFVVDVWALGLARLAVQRGLTVDIETEVMPMARLAAAFPA